MSVLSWQKPFPNRFDLWCYIHTPNSETVTSYRLSFDLAALVIFDTLKLSVEITFPFSVPFSSRFSRLVGLVYCITGIFALPERIENV